MSILKCNDIVKLLNLFLNLPRIAFLSP